MDIQPEIIDPDFFTCLDIFEGAYKKAFEKIECFYHIRLAGGSGAENQCALEKGDSCVRNGH